jgi:hypothetical protein
MASNLVVAVLGNRNSGKSRTWNSLFRKGRSVKTGPRMRKLFLTDTQYVEVFLVSGSPEERKKYVGDIIGQQKPRIVLCSMQYIPGVRQTIQYFTQNAYGFYMHWLNPGYYDDGPYADDLGLLTLIQATGGTVEVRDGKVDLAPRVREMRDYVFRWASEYGLLRTGTPRDALVPV